MYENIEICVRKLLTEIFVKGSVTVAANMLAKLYVKEPPRFAKFYIVNSFSSFCFLKKISKK